MNKAVLTILLVLLPVSAWSLEPVSGLPGCMTVLDRDQWGLTVELQVPQYGLESAQGPDGTCCKVVLDGWARTAETGCPELPVLGCMVPLPATGRLQVEILHSETSIHAVDGIYPVPPLQPDSEFVRVGIPAGPYPAELVRVESPMVRSGRRFARVLMTPFQWDSETGQLSCATLIRARLTYDRFDSVPVDASPDGDGDLRRDIPGMCLQGALRIEIEEDGLYAMDYHQALLDAGVKRGVLDNLDPRTLKLFNQGIEVPLVVAEEGQDVPWPGGNLFFYGQGISNEFTTTNVYWLHWGGSAGARMRVLGSAPVPGAPLAGYSAETLRFEENHRLWEATPGAPQNDYWFWSLMTAPASEANQFYIPQPSPGTWDGTIRACYQGRSTASPHPNHHCRILLNSVDVGDQFWDNDRIFIQEAGFSSDLLNHGWNTISVVCPGDTGAAVDSAYLNWIEVEYRRRLQATDDQLLLTSGAGGPQNIAVHGFTGPAVAVFDVSDPLAVCRLADVSINGSGGGYSAVFGSKATAPARYLALTPDRFLTPSVIEGWSSSGLRGGSLGADYILITPRDFLPAAAPLVQFRQSEGLRAVAVAVEDIYNEFSHGLADPQALKDFLGCAYRDWQPPAPAFVLLLGDANTDYLDHFGTGKQSRVPVHLSLSELGLTPDDNWYVCLDGDDVLPEMYIGRLPAGDAAMAERLVDRLLAHEQSTALAPAHALFVADDEPVFESLNEDLVAMLPKGIRPDRIYLSEYGDPGEVTEDIVRAINRGEMLVHYNGHGSVTAWAGEGIFDTADVASLSNDDALTFVLTMTCLNGYFSQPFYYCMAEELVAAEYGGAVGSFSPSGLSYTWEQDILAPEIFSLIFDQGEDRIGIIVTEAKITAYGLGATEEMVSMFTLLGDPASRLKAWE